MPVNPIERVTVPTVKQTESAAVPAPSRNIVDLLYDPPPALERLIAMVNGALEVVQSHQATGKVVTAGPQRTLTIGERAKLGLPAPVGNVGQVVDAGQYPAPVYVESEPPAREPEEVEEGMENRERLTREEIGELLDDLVAKTSHLPGNLSLKRIRQEVADNRDTAINLIYGRVNGNAG